MLRPEVSSSIHVLPEVRKHTRYGNILIKEELTFFVRPNWGISLYGTSLLSRNKIPENSPVGDGSPEKTVSVFSQTFIPSYTYRFVYGDVRIKGSVGIGYAYTLHNHQYSYTPVNDPEFPEPQLNTTAALPGPAFQAHFALEYRLSEGTYFLFEQGVFGAATGNGVDSDLVNAKSVAIQHFQQDTFTTYPYRGTASLSYVGVYTTIGLRFTLSDF